MSVINRGDCDTEARLRRLQGSDALEAFWAARRALLEAWVQVLPHLSPTEALEEEHGTGNAMAQMRRARMDGGEWR